MNEYKIYIPNYTKNKNVANRVINLLAIKSISMQKKVVFKS